MKRCLLFLGLAGLLVSQPIAATSHLVAGSNDPRARQRISLPQKRKVKRTVRRRRYRHEYRKSPVRSNYQATRNNVSFSTAYSRFIDTESLEMPLTSYVWEEHKVAPFDELILSWNARRPTKGYFSFHVSVLHNGIWSPPHRLAMWGPNVQKSFGSPIRHKAHTTGTRVEVTGGATATGFRVMVTAEHGACIADLHALFASISDLNNFAVSTIGLTMPSIMIPDVPQQSQMVLHHPRKQDLCSPTSTCMMVRYFSRQFSDEVPRRSLHDDALLFAKRVHDGALDIYGNWMLNVAQAYDASNSSVYYRVQRLNTFLDLYNCLKRQIPVAVSVRGWLRGGLKSYDNGHFIVVVGWDKERQLVRCIDPAFRGSASTLRMYRFQDFVRAWGRSRNLSYVALPKSIMPSSDEDFDHESRKIYACNDGVAAAII